MPKLAAHSISFSKLHKVQRTRLNWLAAENKHGLLSVPLCPFAFRFLQCLASLCHLSGKNQLCLRTIYGFMFLIRDLYLRIIYCESVGTENTEYIKPSILNEICHFFNGLTSLCIHYVMMIMMRMIH